MDLGIFTSEMNNSREPSKSHFFSNTIIYLEDKIFETSNFEINFEQVTSGPASLPACLSDRNLPVCQQVSSLSADLSISLSVSRFARDLKSF